MIKKTPVIGLFLSLFLSSALSAELEAPGLGDPVSRVTTSLQPTLHWEDLDNASWYRIWINNDSNGSNVYKTWVKGASSFRLPIHLDEGVTYRWWVRGWNKSDKVGPWSAGRTFTAGQNMVTRERFLSLTDRVDQLEQELVDRETQERFISFSPLEFKSQFSNQTQFITDNAINLYGYFKNGLDGRLGYATKTLNLPDGAEIVTLDAWIYDNASDKPVRMRIHKTKHSEASAKFIAVVGTTNSFASTNVQHLTDSSINQTINNNTHSYFLRFTGEEDTQKTRLYGVRITYEVEKWTK